MNIYKFGSFINFSDTDDLPQEKKLKIQLKMQGEKFKGCSPFEHEKYPSITNR